ncbi:NAD(P)/FAD-dependent oxidoreductase [Ktedonosporobacter rubrisoli]|uniref:NAD(P)/FAD-dependent oxidoreductase n=1 Tax=Ktedonosporobacter rubrisoli TaxID=2509675 RepID=A0A4P6JQL2_KTERU|nr:NAD(P)/FAD-dependent oxidoreductase [Ktedonosporobacter rubrisoli]QBD77718.1 NAD(P)/FAD-dependent oxidoreductase [Ktedonosporobacter rubrisoli]
MSDDNDVLIVGGGPAGLAAAESAAKQGVRALVLERHNEIGYPIHTSGGSWISDMQALGIPQHLYHPISKVVFVSPRREVPLYYNPAVACVVDIRGLYQHLAGRAVAAGAQLRVRHTVEQVQVEQGRVVGVTVKDHTSERHNLRAPVTIDASGISRHIGVRAEMGKAFRRYGYGAEYDMYAPNYPQDELYLIMGSAFAPRGYAWVFPRGNGRVRLGVGVIHPDCDDDARTYLDRIIYDLPN